MLHRNLVWYSMVRDKERVGVMAKDAGLSFEAWKSQVDRAVIRICGMSCDDLPDFAYRKAYDEKKDSQATAARVVRAARDS